MSALTPPKETRHDSRSHANNLLPVLRLLFPAHRSGEIADPVKLRDTCLQGNMERLPKWARSQAWKLLLGYLPREKNEWTSTVEKRRDEYFVRSHHLPQRFLVEFSPSPAPGSQDRSDAILLQVFMCINRALDKDPSFYERLSESWPKNVPPTTSEGHRLFSTARHQLLHRLEQICPEYNAENDYAGTNSEVIPSMSDTESARQPKPPSTTYLDRQWHSMLRILYLYAMMNPCVGNIQGFVYILHALLRVVFESRDASRHGMKNWEAAVLGVEATNAAEADAFWCFSLLVGQFREVFDWGETDQDDLYLYQTSYADMPRFGPNTGIALALRQCSTELRCYDETLWLHLCKHSLDPQTSNYTLRWMACLWTADVPLHVVWQLWDVLLTERFVSSQTHANASVDALVDICCAMLLAIRDQLLDIPSNLLINMETSAKSSDVFLHTLQLLRAYPLSNPRPIISLALQVREHRLLRERNPTLVRTQRRDMRAASEMQTRNTNLQARLAATVNRGLATPPKRIMSGDAPQGPETPSTQAPAGIKAVGHGTSMSQVSDSPGGHSASSLGETPSPGGTISSRLDARLLWRKCTDAIQESDTAAHVSKASTNLAAKSLHWHSKLPKKPEPQKQNIWDPNVPDLPIPAVLDSPRDRQAYSPTVQLQSAPMYIHPASTDLGSRSMSSDEADTSSSLVLPSLENMSYATNLASVQDSLSMWLSSPDLQNPSHITRSSGRQRSRPSPPPKDDVFVASPSTHM